MEVGTVVLVFFALALGLAVGWIAGARRAPGSSTVVEHTRQELGQVREALATATARAELLAQENDQLLDRSRADANILQALAPLAKQLDAVSGHIEQIRERSAAQHSQIVTQLQRDAELGVELNRTTSALNAALRSSSARGNWGEVQLRRIVEAAGMLEHVDFVTQTSVTDSSGKVSRPDLTISLPDGGKIAVDAKVPLDSFLRAQEESSGQSDHLAAHAKAVRGHVQELIKRDYPANFPGSPRLTVMYLPSEALLSTAITADPTLLEWALQAGVVPASPTSFLALLRTVAAVWSSAATATEARDIAQLGNTLVERIAVVVGHLNQLGGALGNSVKHYNAAVGSLENRLLVTARSFSAIPADPGSAKPIASDQAQLRQFSAVEFTDHSSNGTAASDCVG
ncbi:MAG: DNA recombination protein RmuC [Trueperella sp.]|nr:DNA recombination protein RmuC [Trueperella sp.]